MDTKRFHSVRLEGDKCRGCTNCLKRCPTEAIRVRGGRAHIIDERCIDCGECIRVCGYHAKVAVTDPLSSISRFRYKIALPAPSLYGQFKELRGISQVLNGLKQMGFDEAFEVARGADVVSRAIRERLKNPDLPRPVISSACPAIVRLIQVRFPDLIDHIVDVRQPMEVAAMIAKREFARKHGVDEKEIGCFFITPCPAKVTAVRNPIGHEKSAVDGAISVLEIYGLLSSQIRNAPVDITIETASDLGVGWARSGGECKAVSVENAMAVDGIENCIRVLEEIEDNRLRDLEFFEGAACTGGCVGGPLNFENNYVARSNVTRLSSRTPNPELNVDSGMMTKYELYDSSRILPNSAMKLDDDLIEAMRKMERIEAIYKELPGYDCGSCGSPTCRTFAEDIVQGAATQMDCIHKMKEQLKIMAQQMVNLAQTTRE
ncbi:MAG: 4Fe-4S dicluster domain-containing protein [Clostridia bacterium]|nr:4Fe-4S dicluster domain-containing protein [Clostridia bacterium]